MKIDTGRNCEGENPEGIFRKCLAICAETLGKPDVKRYVDQISGESHLGFSFSVRVPVFKRNCCGCEWSAGMGLVVDLFENLLETAESRSRFERPSTIQILESPDEELDRFPWDSMKAGFSFLCGIGFGDRERPFPNLFRREPEEILGISSIGLRRFIFLVDACICDFAVFCDNCGFSLPLDNGISRFSAKMESLDGEILRHQEVHFEELAARCPPMRPKARTPFAQ